MHVNSLRQIFQTRRGQLFLAAVILVSAVFSLAALAPDQSELRSKRMNIAMRAIGHDLLLRAGDFTSVIPPVIEKSPGVFFIEFDNEFAFQPDTLVEIVQRHLGQTGVFNYAATVHPCNRPYVVYGFENSTEGNTTIPCRGRQHPKACYTVQIAFTDYPGPKVPFGPTALIITGVLSALGLVLIRGNMVTRKSAPPPVQEPLAQNEGNLIFLGKFIFDTSLQTLRIEEEIIPLTDKECKILTILNQNIGRLTSRDQLIQEVWTDEGVITGRSLDMFISKLRKKLGRDGDIRITAIHGKGYRLDVP